MLGPRAPVHPLEAGSHVLSDSSIYKKHHQDALWTREAEHGCGEMGTRILMGGHAGFSKR